MQSAENCSRRLLANGYFDVAVSQTTLTLIGQVTVEANKMVSIKIVSNNKSNAIYISIKTQNSKYN